jgi:hypothetical protein
MTWAILGSFIALGVAMALGLVIVMYSSVSKYAKRLDPGAKAREGDQGPDSRPKV